MSTLNSDHKIPGARANMLLRIKTKDVQIKNNTVAIPSAFRLIPKPQVFLKGLGSGASLCFRSFSEQLSALVSRRDFTRSPITEPERRAGLVLCGGSVSRGEILLASHRMSGQRDCVSCVPISARLWQVETGRQLGHHLEPPFPVSDFICKSDFQTILKTT